MEWVIAILFISELVACMCAVAYKQGIRGWRNLPLCHVYFLSEYMGLRQLGMCAIASTVATAILLPWRVGPLVAFGLFSTMFLFAVWVVFQYYLLEFLNRPRWLIAIAIFLPPLYYPLLLR